MNWRQLPAQVPSQRCHLGWGWGASECLEPRVFSALQASGLEWLCFVFGSAAHELL